MTEANDTNPVTSVRAFNRFWTTRIGALGGSHLQSTYSLTEARVLFELAQRGSNQGMEVADLRRELELDAGYLSRILSRFKADRLVSLESSETDARKQVAYLTNKGRDIFLALDAKSAEWVSSMLSSLSAEDKRRLVVALHTARTLLEGAPQPPSYLLRPLRPGDLGWVIRRHGIVYGDEYGYDASFEALVARIMADYIENYDPELENAFIAEMDGEPVGSIFCVKKTATIAQLRCLIVDPKARGMGVGSRLVDECIRFARRAGYKKMVLWTHDSLVAARHIYERAGFTLQKQEKNHSFGQPVVDQTWSLTL
ncbi:helix-turn-helix domain-containing GNAT family N-acetyltransferase [Pendulispora brunnea]|uniref:Helix-turn-helix domain-containing GNAT family N-acetyltransferase n=1 Tax=Pendulispora brunnea TaxID=2905690 RepID=A0ABZ2KKG0_9BACT